MHTNASTYLVIGTLVLLCGGCDGSDFLDPEDFDILGTWAVTRVEGSVGPVNQSNSLWTFEENGTYDWFFFFSGYFDLKGQGTYRLEGTTLTLTGVVAETVLETIPGGRVTLTLRKDEFRFRDDEGDEWTYVRVQGG